MPQKNEDNKAIGGNDINKETVVQTAIEIKDAIDLMIKQVTLINTLWGIYAVASFTAAGFGFNLDPSRWGYNAVLLLAALGFTVFLVGHWKMLRMTVKANDILGEYISKTMRSKGYTPGVLFSDSVMHIA